MLQREESIAIVASFAGLLTFLILVLIEGQRRRTDRLAEDAELRAVEGYMESQVFSQVLVVAAAVGVVGSIGWLFLQAIEAPALQWSGRALGPILISGYSLMLLIAYTILQLGILGYLRDQAAIIRKLRK